MGHVSRIVLGLLLVVASCTTRDKACSVRTSEGSYEGVLCPGSAGAAPSTNVCAELSTDPGNCGVCGHGCGLGGQCVGGVCRCPSRNLANDPSHCGACGN